VVIVLGERPRAVAVGQRGRNAERQQRAERAGHHAKLGQSPHDPSLKVERAAWRIAAARLLTWQPAAGRPHHPRLAIDPVAGHYTIGAMPA
jgi:hypothetical protein